MSIECDQFGRYVPEYFNLLQHRFQYFKVFQMRNISVTIEELNILQQAIIQMISLNDRSFILPQCLYSYRKRLLQARSLVILNIYLFKTCILFSFSVASSVS